MNMKTPTKFPGICQYKKFHTTQTALTLRWVRLSIQEEDLHREQDCPQQRQCSHDSFTARQRPALATHIHEENIAKRRTERDRPNFMESRTQLHGVVQIRTSWVSSRQSRSPRRVLACERAAEACRVGTEDRSRRGAQLRAASSIEEDTLGRQS